MISNRTIELKTLSTTDHSEPRHEQETSFFSRASYIAAATTGTALGILGMAVGMATANPLPILIAGILISTSTVYLSKELTPNTQIPSVIPMISAFQGHPIGGIPPFYPEAKRRHVSHLPPFKV